MLYNKIIAQLAEINDLHEPSTGKFRVPSALLVNKSLELIRKILFPGFFEEDSTFFAEPHELNSQRLLQLTETLKFQIETAICFHAANARNVEVQADIAVKNLINRLPELKQQLIADAKAIYLCDPAACTIAEIIASYPGFKAIFNYRIANFLHKLNVPFIPRIITELAHSETGIDIHPGASIGHAFAIDHGTGIVIGETAIIGNHVTVYQGVTLGAKNFPTDACGVPIKGIARHPIIENHAVIYAHATILGRIKIGEHSVIGGNVWVTESVAPFSKVFQQKHKQFLFAEGLGI